MRRALGKIAKAIALAVRSPASRRPSRSRVGGAVEGRRRYPGDFTGTFAARYAAKLDGHADPGEVLWTWVPYEDDPSQGKDRPVLAIGEHKDWLLCLMLTSKDHDRDAADESRWGRRWMDIGSGPWDRMRRPSEVRLDRIIRIHPDDVRREGAVLDRKTFDEVIGSL
jgi:hypothetical protein